jgi:hypothetical protein
MIPEPSTCVVMLAGFAGLELAGYRCAEPAGAQSAAQFLCENQNSMV